MCKPASFVVTKKKVYWSKLSDSHEEIIREFKLEKLDQDPIRGSNLVRVEISPSDKDLSRPLSEWKYQLDQEEVPEWHDATDTENRCRVELEQWAKCKLTGWKVHEAFHPVDPLLLDCKPLPDTILLALLKEWASVGASVRTSVWTSVRDSVRYSVRDSVRYSFWDLVRASVGSSVGASFGDSVRYSYGALFWDSVRDSVGAYIGGLFPNITEWKYAEKLGANPWEPLLTLWYAGYFPSFDGTTWRLHRGKEAQVVLEWKPEEKP